MAALLDLMGQDSCYFFGGDKSETYIFCEKSRKGTVYSFVFCVGVFISLSQVLRFLEMVDLLERSLEHGILFGWESFLSIVCTDWIWPWNWLAKRGGLTLGFFSRRSFYSFDLV